MRRRRKTKERSDEGIYEQFLLFLYRPRIGVPPCAFVQARKFDCKTLRVFSLRVTR